MNKTNINQKRGIVRKFIQKTPGCTYLDIKNSTKIKVERIYENMLAAYFDAGVSLPQRYFKRNKAKQKEEVISFLRKNPVASVIEIQEATKVNIPQEFGSIKSVYELAGINYPERSFEKGVANPEVCKRSHLYEREVISKFKELGEVYYHVRCKEGVLDAIFLNNGVKHVIEVKDFRGRNNITKYQIKQIYRYMKCLNIKEGIIVCPKDSFPKRKNRRNLFIGDFRIRIISPDEV